VRPVRVAIGVIAGVRGGPATYGVELVRALDAMLATDHYGVGGVGASLEVTVLTDQPARLGELRDVRVREVPLRSSWWQPWWDNVAVPAALRELGADVYHGTKHALPLLRPRGAPATVVTIHDLAVYAQPETFSRAQRLQLRVHLRHAAARADRIICDSQHAAADVRSRLDVRADRVTVIPLGVGAQYAPLPPGEARQAARRSFGVDDGFLAAFAGTWQPRKHIEVAIDAVGRLRDAGLPVTLAVAGRRRPGFAAPWMAHPPPWTRLLGELDDASLARLYGAADVMVSPSTYEGFGLTFVEAMACGCPVVGLRATSIPEVVGNGGLLVERPEVGLVAWGIETLLRDPELRAEMSGRALKRAAAFSWSRTARETAAVYVDVASRRVGVAETAERSAEAR
jgi:glycosyltransferase involved in cell wall biosynthesis